MSKIKQLFENHFINEMIDADYQYQQWKERKIFEYEEYLHNELKEKAIRDEVFLREMNLLFEEDATLEDFSYGL